MTVDHAGGIFDAEHLHGDSGARWVPGSPLPAGEFLTRWVTHLCAPTFVMLAGASLALSLERRRAQPDQTRFIVTRGILIASLDPLWMSLGFASFRVVVLQVLYAIGLSMVCMAWLRKLPSPVLLAGAIAVQVGGELSDRWHPAAAPLRALWSLLFMGGPVVGPVFCAYPLIPWLSFMMIGWVFGRWLLAPRPRLRPASFCGLVGAGLLAVFGLVRGLDGYGNWNLHRDSMVLLQWLHVAKYPPSLAYTSLELGIAFVLLACFLAVDRSERPHVLLTPLALFGSTAFFYYLLHVHLMAAAEAVLSLDTHTYGLAKTWVAAGTTAVVLAAPCWAYRRYKATHPDGWARYI